MRPSMRPGLSPSLRALRSLCERSFVVAAAATALAFTPLVATAGDESVTDLTSANASVIESGDIVEALAVPRGTRIRPGARPTVRLPIYFEVGSAELEPDARVLLDKVASALESNDLETFSFSVEGHTDSLGEAGYNQSLSQERADSVKKYLMAKGVPESRLKTMGRGESVPVASNDDNDGRSKNRRVELINMGSN